MLTLFVDVNLVVRCVIIVTQGGWRWDEELGVVVITELNVALCLTEMVCTCSRSEGQGSKHTSHSGGKLEL